MNANTTPLAIEVHTQSRVLEIEFEDGLKANLPFEFLRVYSPSAEVRGHGVGQETLQTGKREVGIEAVEPVGHYAIQLHFTDGHNSGIFSWDYLHKLASQQQTMWADYLAKLQAAGYAGETGRDAPMHVASHQHGPGCAH